MNFTNDEMNLMCIYSAGSSRTGLMQKLTEMKMYLERDEVQLLSLTESTLSSAFEGGADGHLLRRNLEKIP